MKIQLTLPQKISLYFMVLLVIYWGVLFFTGTKEGFHNFFYSFLFGLTPLIGGVIAIFNAKIWGGLKTTIGKAVFFVGLGVFLWGAGETVWSYYNFILKVPAPYPSLADIGFAPSIFFYGLGVLYLSKVTGATLGLKSKVAKFFVAISPFVIIPFAWHILVNIARNGVLIPEGETGLKIILDIVYPLGSFVALAIAIIISGLSFKYMGGKYKMSIVSLLLGLLVMFIGDTIFSYTTTIGTFYNANFGDLVLTTGTFLLTFGILGFYRHREPITITSGDSSERVYNKIAYTIIKEQEILMGPVAWFEAEQITELQIIDSESGHDVNIPENVDGMIVLDNLVDRYVALFGPAASEVCKRASSSMVADLDHSLIPFNLR